MSRWLRTTRTRNVTLALLTACTVHCGGGRGASTQNGAGGGAGTTPHSQDDAGSQGSGGAVANVDSGAGTSNNGGSAGSSEDAGETPGISAPEITGFSPESGPYGTTVTIVGNWLGSAARAGVSLTLAGDENDISYFPGGPELLSWTENEITFPYPFPQSGTITLQTPQGTAVAGSFLPDWVAGPSTQLAAGASVLVSIAPSAGTLVAAFDTTPVTIITFDGSSWSESSLDAAGTRPGTLRLFVSDAEELLAFALSDADPPEIVTFTPDGTSWVPTDSGVTVTSTFAVAGGPDGAAIWSQTGTDWSRVRFAAGAWSVDKGPIADPNPTASNHTAGATSDGSLYVAWDQDTGNFLDDMGAPFMQQLEENAATFTATFAAGNSVDDFVTSIELENRGRGLLVYYCGSDVDPFGLSATGYKCFTAAHSSGGARLFSGFNESAPTRYGASLNQAMIGFCDDAGLHLTLDPVNALGDAAIWPCPTSLDALEIDTGGQPRIMIRAGGLMYAPHPRSAPVQPLIDAGVADAAGD